MNQKCHTLLASQQIWTTNEPNIAHY